MKSLLIKIVRIVLLVNGVNIFFTSSVQAVEQKLSILTSFGSATTVTFQRAFENKYPHIKLEIQRKKTDSAIKFIEENYKNGDIDIFWASSPDAFQTLKDKKLLLRYDQKITGIPKKIGSSNINDLSGYYKGFAVSGYGIMENTNYTNALTLPLAMEWNDLKNPIYKDHIGMSSASRSGTTHLIIENVLQAQGWQQGWMTWKEIAANVKMITARSTDVPKGVNKGHFGIGLVIDYYALSFQALGFPISFTYPRSTVLLPANIAIINNAPNKKAAKTFINFVLSDTGQKILLEAKISRLPIKPRVYEDTNRNFPNPFVDKTLGANINFDVNLSKERYKVVNSLFDIMITYNLDALKKAMYAIYSAEKAIKKNSNPEAQQWLEQARQLMAWVPVNSDKAAEFKFNALFTVSRKKESTPVTGEQARIEKEWDRQIKKNYAEAVRLAEKSRWAH